MVGAMLGWTATKAPAQEVVIPPELGLRVCPECEAKRLDRLAKQPCNGAVTLNPENTGDLIFIGEGGVEILRACDHRMWVNPAIKTNEAAKEFARCFRGFLGR